MKYIISIISVLALTASAYAGCGKKVASIGKIQGYDAEAKALTIRVMDSNDAEALKAKTAKLTMTPDSKVIAEGKIESLVGKRVTIVSEHGKIDYVIALAAKGKKAAAKS